MLRLFALCVVVSLALPLSAQEKAAAPATQTAFQPFGRPLNQFTLYDANGQPFTPYDLHGTIWVAHFFYPGCNGVCTRTVPNMKRLQETFRGKPYVRFVSIALNSDTPSMLQQFAKAQNAEPEQWLFLTGEADETHKIVEKCFFNHAARNSKPTIGNEIEHSSRLVLIDPNGVMIGYVDGKLDGSADVMQREIERLRLEQPIPITGAMLPMFNAILNATCTVLLLLGWTLIRLRYETLHKIVMLLALMVSVIFLSSYLFYHFAVLGAEPMRFRGEGTIRYIYFAILLSHTILAVTVAPLAIYITVQGLRDARRMHVKVARWTLPIWLYVSITGVVVYWMLYRVEW